MGERKTVKATITKDAQKLWSCENFRFITPKEHRGKLPLSAGEEIVLYSPGETPSTICQGQRSWRVKVPPKSMGERGVGMKVCEHQLDGV